MRPGLQKKKQDPPALATCPRIPGSKELGRAPGLVTRSGGFSHPVLLGPAPVNISSLLQQREPFRIDIESYFHSSPLLPDPLQLPAQGQVCKSGPDMVYALTDKGECM